MKNLRDTGLILTERGRECGIRTPPLLSRPWKYYSLAGNNLPTLFKGVNTATRASLGEAHGVCDDFQETCQIL